MHAVIYENVAPPLNPNPTPPYVNEVATTKAVEAWLNDIETEMILGLYTGAEKACKEYPEDERVM